MKKFNNSEKVAGEMAIRSLSDKAAEFYNGADPLTSSSTKRTEPNYTLIPEHLESVTA